MSAKGIPISIRITPRASRARFPNSVWVNQFANPANPQAHEETTGPEIWEQMDHHVDAMVCGVGSGGTITGLSRYFARVHPDLELVLADPQGSALAEYVITGHLGKSGPSVVEGIGSGQFRPSPISRGSRDAFTIPDAESLARRARAAARTPASWPALPPAPWSPPPCAIAASRPTPSAWSPSSATAATSTCPRCSTTTGCCDQGFLDSPKQGDLRDLITRRYEEGAVITVGPDDTLLTAFQRMRMADISQVPVMRGRPRRRHPGRIGRADVRPRRSRTLPRHRCAPP